jgi:uncharacterized damage-inducible protein DinB
MAAEFAEEAAKTRRMLERVPWDKADWRPHPKSMPMGALASHVAQLAGFPALIVTTEGRDIAQPGGAAPARPTSTAGLLEVFDRNAAASEKALGSARDADLQQTWTLRQGERVLLSLPRGVAARGMGIHHSIHHRAQLGVYLRLNDVPVPGMYGPSADEA